MASWLERFLPARLGAEVRWLTAGAWVANIGDGINLAAGPLLIASATHSAFLVAAAALLQRLPWVLFGLVAGVVADRLDRRALIVGSELFRVVVLLVLVLTLLGGRHVGVAVVLGAMFALGSADVFSNTTSSTLLPMLVGGEDLGLANSRLQGSFVISQQLAGPPLGAALFSLGRAWPFLVQGAIVLVALWMVWQIGPRRVDDTVRGPSRVRADIREGLSWLLGHPAMRTLALIILVFNITWGAAWSVLVLYATERLGLGAVGFGLVTTVGAVGGLAGTASYGWITRRLSLGDIMRIGLVIETFTHLALALTTRPWVAMVIFFVFGAHAFIWGTTSITVRQRAVPSELQGRVGGVNLVGVYGGLVIGSG
ncbi:MAG TPA: MFS transporter, partial [Solirubrobacteraceae bacterium]|nr:MFS transporter [Solirubrobacteraceae bacterium]